MSGRRIARSNLVWVCGIAAGLVVGSLVAYGVAGSATMAHARR